MNPEDSADEVEDIVTMLFEDGMNGRMLTRQQWATLNDALENKVQTMTYATVLCLSQETRQFLEGFTDGVPDSKGVHDLLLQTLA